MTLFHRWREAFSKKPTPKQVTWICGTETVLADEVIDRIREQLKPDPWNDIRLDAEEVTSRTLRSELGQYPLGQGIRLLVIRHAEAVRDWDFLLEWLPRRAMNPKTFVILVSDEAAIPMTDPPPEERKKGVRPEALEHVALIQKRGVVIECRPFTNATAKHSVPWAQSLMPMRAGVAQHLIERADFQTRLVRDACVKLKALGLTEVQITHINLIMAEQPRDDFVDALIARDMHQVWLALPLIDVSETGRIIGLLDSRVDLAGLVHDMMVEHKSPAEIAKAAGKQAFLVRDLMPVAKHYNSKRRLELRKVLAEVDTAWQQGYADGALEVVASFW